MNEIIIGIDLGTTNSEVAFIKDGQPVVIPDHRGIKMLPSFVGVDQQGELLVGEEARNQFVAFPDRTIKSIKRKMGSDESVEMAGQSYKPQEISAMILKQLKTTAEAYLGQLVNEAVITVPAYFNDRQRQVTREAGEIAGLEVLRMINEPTAAALSYETGHHEGKRILVYDLGGGTFDVSMVEIQDGVVQVVSSHGNNQLGGDDFDQKIFEHICDHLQKTHGVDVKVLTNVREVEARILRAATEAKIALSNKPFVSIEEEYLTDKDGIPVNLTLELSREDYEQMIMPFIEETLDAVHVALSDASMTVSDVEEILLVGGSTKTPSISQMLEAEVGLTPRGELDPDLCVAMGAAIQAGMIAGESVSAVLVDVTPYTFGTSVYGELNGLPHPAVYSPVIDKNTSIPVTKSEVYYTMNDNQPAVDVQIYQGEAIDANDNLLIGEFRVEGLSKVPAPSPIVLQLSLDSDGILNVTATEKYTGLEKNIVIENAFTRMDQDDLEQSRHRLTQMFREPENSSDSSVIEEDNDFIEARALIEKGQKMLDDAAPEDREEIVDLIETINDAIEAEQKEGLTATMTELSEILYYLES